MHTMQTKSTQISYKLEKWTVFTLITAGLNKKMVNFIYYRITETKEQEEEVEKNGVQSYTICEINVSKQKR